MNPALANTMSATWNPVCHPVMSACWSGDSAMPCDVPPMSREIAMSTTATGMRNAP